MKQRWKHVTNETGTLMAETGTLMAVGSLAKVGYYFSTVSLSIFYKSEKMAENKFSPGGYFLKRDEKVDQTWDQIFEESFYSTS